jgi:hypothetical protein
MDSGKPLLATSVRIIKEITSVAYLEGIIQRGHADRRAPLVTPKQIRFARVGAGKDKDSAFCFRATTANGHGSCDPDRKRYDQVVMKVLLIIMALRGGFELHSESSWFTEWSEPMRWCNARLGGAHIEYGVLM